VAKQIERLSSTHVTHAKPGMHADGSGLYLQVTIGKEGQLCKSWIFRFERNDEERHMGLGSLNAIGLKDAREKARWCRQVLSDGKDPIDVRDAERSAAKADKSKSATFQWCSVQYMKLREPGWRNAKHRQQWTNTPGVYVNPVIGSVQVDAITTDMILKILAPIWATKNETASRIRGRIKASSIGRRRTAIARATIQRGGAVTSNTCL
jgi:Arm DNA-binding domain